MPDRGMTMFDTKNRWVRLLVTLDADRQHVKDVYKNMVARVEQALQNPRGLTPDTVATLRMAITALDQRRAEALKRIDKGCDEALQKIKELDNTPAHGRD